jgi:hypothetical protein
LQGTWQTLPIVHSFAQVLKVLVVYVFTLSLSILLSVGAVPAALKAPLGAHKE